MRVSNRFFGTQTVSAARLRTSVRPALYAVVICSLLLFGLVRSVAVYDSAAKQQAYTPVAKHTVTAPKATVSIAPNGAAVTAIAPAKTITTMTPVAPNCTPDTVYTGPASLDLTTATTGLTTSIDAVHYYQVNGNTNSQIRQQINTCAPKLSGDDDFTGYTSYKLSWQYGYVGNVDGSCSLSAIKLGVHIGEVLPAWTPTNYATPGLASKWSTFAAALDTHERGHVALDQQNAAQILARLQAMPATDCATIVAQATAIINSGVAALDTANVTYDNQTNHGATQGAILP